MSVVTTRAVLLRTHAYGETSLILRFFTEDLGIVGVMARGARKQGSQGRSGLKTFASGPLTLFIKSTRDLQTMKDFAAANIRRELGGNVIRFAGASLIAELILRHGGEAAAPVLYDRLEAALDDVASADRSRLVPTVLAEAWALVATLGYHPVLDACVGCGRTLEPDEMGRFDMEAGGVGCSDCGAGGSGPRVGPGAREQVSALLLGEPVPLTKPRAHLRLLGDFITYHVSENRPLESVGFLASLLPAAEGDP